MGVSICGEYPAAISERGAVQLFRRLLNCSSARAGAATCTCGSSMCAVCQTRGALRVALLKGCLDVPMHGRSAARNSSTLPGTAPRSNSGQESPRAGQQHGINVARARLMGGMPIQPDPPRDGDHPDNFLPGRFSPEAAKAAAAPPRHDAPVDDGRRRAGCPLFVTTLGQLVPRPIEHGAPSRSPYSS
jgi:hypothetical protein